MERCQKLSNVAQSPFHTFPSPFNPSPSPFNTYSLHFDASPSHLRDYHYHLPPFHPLSTPCCSALAPLRRSLTTLSCILPVALKCLMPFDASSSPLNTSTSRLISYLSLLRHPHRTLTSVRRLSCTCVGL